jgi:DNA topoisomerase-1
LLWERQQQYLQEKVSFNLESMAYIKHGRSKLPLKRMQLKQLTQTQLLQELPTIRSVMYRSCESKEATSSPPFPLITSSLQTGAFTKYKWSPKQTMQYAQRLYEGGYITYMRTDCQTLSTEFTTQAKAFILEKWGATFVGTGTRRSTHVTGAQEAHEAIRPTHLETKQPDDLDANCIKLYKWIYNHTLASLMSASTSLVTTHTFHGEIPSKPVYTYTTTSVLFAGYKVLTLRNEEEEHSEEENEKENKVIDKLTIGQSYPLEKHTLFESLNKINKPYSPAETIKLLEKNGIGRPSTYSGILERLEARAYIEKDTWEPVMVQLHDWEIVLQGENDSVVSTTVKEKKAGDLNGCYKVTPLGGEVVHFLNNCFQLMVDYDFTKKMEITLDQIASDEYHFATFIQTFYQQLHSIILNVKETLPSQYTLRVVFEENEEAKYGVTRVRSDWVFVKAYHDKRKKWAFAKFPSTLSSPEDATLSDFQQAFQYPKEVGQYENQSIKIKVGPYGKYINYGKVNVAFPSELDDEDVTRMIELIQSAEKKKNENIIRVLNDEISVRRGKYGAYVFIDNGKGKKPTFISVMKRNINVEELTPELVYQMQKQKWQKPKEKTESVVVATKEETLPTKVSKPRKTSKTDDPPKKKAKIEKPSNTDEVTSKAIKVPKPRKTTKTDDPPKKKAKIEKPSNTDEVKPKVTKKPRKITEKN